MTGSVLQHGSTVLCAHGGQAVPVGVSPRVRVGGSPVATVGATYVVSGCPFKPPSGGGPCVTARWTDGAARVLVTGQPVVTSASGSLCVPTGASLVPVRTQTRVHAG